MIRCEVIEAFTLSRFNELKDITRAGVDTPNQLNVGDTFICEKDLANYLLGENKVKRAFVKVIEVIPEEKTIEKPKVTLNTTIKLNNKTIRKKIAKK